MSRLQQQNALCRTSRAAAAQQKNRGPVEAVFRLQHLKETVAFEHHWSLQRTRPKSYSIMKQPVASQLLADQNLKSTTSWTNKK